MIFIIYTSCHSLHITAINWTCTWPASSEVVEHCTGIAEVMRSNPVGASQFFLGFINCLSYVTRSKISFAFQLLYLAFLKLSNYLLIQQQQQQQRQQQRQQQQQQQQQSFFKAERVATSVPINEWGLQAVDNNNFNRVSIVLCYCKSYRKCMHVGRMVVLVVRWRGDMPFPTTSDYCFL